MIESGINCYFFKRLKKVLFMIKYTKHLKGVPTPPKTIIPSIQINDNVIPVVRSDSKGDLNHQKN